MNPSPLLDRQATRSEIAESIGLVVMPSNNTGHQVRALAKRFPGRIAHLIGPGGWRAPFLPYALDNGAYGAYVRHAHFDEAAFLSLLGQARACDTAPQWVAVPDVVADREATIAAWRVWEPRLRPFGWPLAFVVQDGMRRECVPPGADVVFIGGTTRWKWSMVPAFSTWFPRVHVGRVNRPNVLAYLEDLGVESIDGTGWLRGDRRQLMGLVEFLEGSRNLKLFDAPQLSPLPVRDSDPCRTSAQEWRDSAAQALPRERGGA